MEDITKMKAGDPGRIPRGRGVGGGGARGDYGRMAGGIGGRELLGLPCRGLF